MEYFGSAILEADGESQRRDVGESGRGRGGMEARRDSERSVRLGDIQGGGWVGIVGLAQCSYNWGIHGRESEQSRKEEDASRKKNQQRRVAGLGSNER